MIIYPSENENNPRRHHSVEYQRARRAKMTSMSGVKSVTVFYPDISLPDYYTLAEYKRRQGQFDADAVIYIAGVKQAAQERLA